jgi:hypothetical protein
VTVESKTAGQKLEGVAFSFCKAATVALVFQKFALPAAALLSAVFFLLAIAYGKNDTRCALRYPLLIAAFWLAVAGAWLYVYLR